MTETDLILCELLVLRFQRHDRTAAEELVALFEKPLLYYLRRLVRSEVDAWDLLQETSATSDAYLKELLERSPSWRFSATVVRASASELPRQFGLDLPKNRIPMGMHNFMRLAHFGVVRKPAPYANPVRLVALPPNGAWDSEPSNRDLPQSPQINVPVSGLKGPIPAFKNA